MRLNAANRPSSASFGVFPMEGLILDMDGTLFDSERLHVIAWRRVLRAVGLQYPEAWFQEWIGKPDRQLPQAVLAEHRLPLNAEQLLDRKEAVYHDLARARLAPYPGVEERLRALAAVGLPMAVATSSSRADARRSLAWSGLGDLFPIRVTLEDVEAAKPDPAPYRVAARRLGLDPARCLAIEDSPSGVLSATKAGCLTFAVRTTHPAEALDQAHRIYGSTIEALDAAGAEGLPALDVVVGRRDAIGA